MRRNIELKARFPDLEFGRSVAQTIGAQLHGIERQRDTYFSVPRGRLKLRQRWTEESVDATRDLPAPSPHVPMSQLIWYERSSDARARPSDYALVEIPDGEAMRSLLAGALGILTEVTKRRTIYLFDNVRIHLDELPELGTFLEFEAIVGGGCDDRAAEQKVRRLKESFSVSDSSILSVSYEDLWRDMTRTNAS